MKNTVDGRVTWQTSSRLQVARILCVGIIVAGVTACDKDESPGEGNKPERISSKIDVSSTPKLTERESKLVSMAATRILKHSGQARQAINDKKFVLAQERVDNALKLVGIIENALPPTMVETELKSGDLAYHDKETLRRQLKVPVLESLLRTDELATDAQVEDTLQKVKQKSHTKAQTKSQPVEEEQIAGNEETSASTAKATADQTPTVRDVEYADETVDLDITFAKQQLKLAAKQLLDDKPAKATEALDAIDEDGLSVHLAILEVPFEAIGDNLTFAEYEVAHGRATEASVAVKTASKQLQEYITQSDDNDSEEVEKIQKRISNLNEEIHNQLAAQESVGNASKPIGHWWNRAWDWVTRTRG